MIRNEYRIELARLMASDKRCRQPVIRRSSQAEWLYATDLPCLYKGEVPEAMAAELTAAGWEFREERNWLLLRKNAPEPPGDWFEGIFGPEADCCRSLLARHPDRACEAPEAAQRILIKAGEEGEKAYEAACAALHRSWAERLRRGERLPALSLNYFCI